MLAKQTDPTESNKGEYFAQITALWLRRSPGANCGSRAAPESRAAGPAIWQRIPEDALTSRCSAGRSGVFGLH
jgi:hypothetical protein